MTRRKLTKSQRRVLRRLANIENRPFRPRFRSDLDITRKLIRRGYIAIGAREVSPSRWILLNLLTPKGRAALGTAGCTRE